MIMLIIDKRFRIKDFYAVFSPPVICFVGQDEQKCIDNSQKLMMCKHR